jgi:hypothetical protein
MSSFSQALYSEIVAKGMRSDQSSHNDNNLSSKLVEGENGALAHKSAALSNDDLNGLLTEVFLLMRGESSDIVTEKLSNVYQQIKSNKEYMVKLLKLCLYLREPRKGKGERLVFYNIVQWMWVNDNKVAKYMINNLSNFGSYIDFCNLYKLSTSAELKYYLVEVYGNQLVKDKDNEKPSLAGKWAPREQSKFSDFAKEITKRFFNKDKKVYRQLIVSLNKRLTVPEVNMCAKDWSSIEFKNVASKAMTTYTKAFQDVKTSPFPKEKRHKFKSGRRHDELHQDYEDRDKCRQNLVNHIASGSKINATVTDLASIIERYLRHETEDPIWEAQWNYRINEIKELLKQSNYKPKIFPMIDLSGSMNGSPMINAITLGFFTSILIDNELNESEAEYANMFLTFNSKPEIGKLERGASLHNKIKSLTDNGWMSKWGGNTNIQSAFQMILDIATKHNVSKENMPQVLAIFSDMQFDQGDRSWSETSYEMMNRMFTEKGYDLPHIIFWNLRANTSGYQVTADKPNTTMLSGYSTRMMDLFLTSSIEDQKNALGTQSTETPLKNASTVSLMEKVFEHPMFEQYNDEINQLFD